MAFPTGASFAAGLLGQATDQAFDRLETCPVELIVDMVSAFHALDEADGLENPEMLGSSGRAHLETRRDCPSAKAAVLEENHNAKPCFGRERSEDPGEYFRIHSITSLSILAIT
jgi:hypothetical protein